MKMFIQQIRPSPDDTILDVGGYPSFWENSGVEAKGIITLNLGIAETPKNMTPQVQTIVGDGCDLQFLNDSFPILFSNSVIEHVGTLAKQQNFAREVRRVGVKLWIQTPAFAFPIEPHYLAPFMHWLPWSVRKLLLPFTPPVIFRSMPISEFYATMKTTRILKKKEFSDLFPDCVILTERLFGVIPKCYIAIRLA